MFPLPDWQRRYNFGVTAHQEQQRGVNRSGDLAPATVGIDTYETFTSRGVLDNRPRIPGSALFRFLVTDPDAAPDVVLAQRTDGTTETAPDVPIRVYWAREVDEEIYAFKPVGGTDAIYDGKPVEWLETYTLGRAEFDGMMPMFEGGQWVLQFNRAVALPGL